VLLRLLLAPARYQQARRAGGRPQGRLVSGPAPADAAQRQPWLLPGQPARLRLPLLPLLPAGAVRHAAAAPLELASAVGVAGQ
jgi:hypothetical protein